VREYGVSAVRGDSRGQLGGAVVAAIRQKSLRLGAVSTEGPVVVSVDAGHWTLYDGGVARWRFRAHQGLNEQDDTGGHNLRKVVMLPPLSVQSLRA